MTDDGTLLPTLSVRRLAGLSGAVPQRKTLEEKAGHRLRREGIFEVRKQDITSQLNVMFLQVSHSLLACCGWWTGDDTRSAARWQVLVLLWMVTPRRGGMDVTPCNTCS